MVPGDGDDAGGVVVELVDGAPDGVVVPGDGVVVGVVVLAPPFFASADAIADLKDSELDLPDPASFVPTELDFPPPVPASIPAVAPILKNSLQSR